jgi:hypothetical protein
MLSFWLGLRICLSATGVARGTSVCQVNTLVSCLREMNPEGQRRGSGVEGKSVSSSSLGTRPSPLGYFYFIVILSPAGPNVRLAPRDVERTLIITPSELRIVMPPMPPARVNPASAAI